VFASNFRDHETIPEVSQREYIYTSINKHQYVQTYGAYTCLAVVFYSQVSQVGVLAHIDSATRLEKALEEILPLFGESEISIRIYGGQAPYNLEKSFVSSLEKYHLIPDLIIRNLSSKDSKNIVLDLETGDVVEYDEMVASTNYQMRAAKVDRLKFSKKLFRHEDSSIAGDLIEIDESINHRDFFPLGFLP